MIYTNVSFVGSTALAEELVLQGETFADGVIVTQVVPAVSGYSRAVLDYKDGFGEIFSWRETGLRVIRRIRGRENIGRSAKTRWTSAGH